MTIQRSVSSMSRCGCSRNFAISILNRPGRARITPFPISSKEMANRNLQITNKTSPLEGEVAAAKARRVGGTAHRPVSFIKRQNARDLRKNMTDAERKLWSKLRLEQFHNLKF